LPDRPDWAASDRGREPRARFRSKSAFGQNHAEVRKELQPAYVVSTPSGVERHAPAAERQMVHHAVGPQRPDMGEGPVALGDRPFR
jgi:hypothetical protein